jgi:hypothetical protein
MIPTVQQSSYCLDGMSEQIEQRRRARIQRTSNAMWVAFGTLLGLAVLIAVALRWPRKPARHALAQRVVLPGMALELPERPTELVGDFDGGGASAPSPVAYQLRWERGEVSLNRQALRVAADSLAQAAAATAHAKLQYTGTREHAIGDDHGYLFEYALGRDGVTVAIGSCAGRLLTFAVQTEDTALATVVDRMLDSFECTGRRD